MKNTQQLERIRQAVMEKYAGTTDVCVRNGLKRWGEQRCENLEEPLGELAHTITSPEMDELAIQWHVADIEENIAIERTRLAHLRAGQARVRFVSALAEIEGVYANSDDMNVIISRMEVWKIDKEVLRKTLPRKVVEFSRAVARGEVPLADLAEGKLPSAFKEIRLIGEFANDLADFLVRTGEEGKALIKEICDDVERASDLAERGCPDGMPDCGKAPLQFLAKQVVETRASQATLNGKRRAIGFNAA